MGLSCFFAMRSRPINPLHLRLNIQHVVHTAECPTLLLKVSHRRGLTLHKGALTEVHTMVAGGHVFARHLQQDAYIANLACKN